MKVVIVGAGPAGLMAGYQAALKGHDVLVVDGQPRAGTKLLHTGNGRCNITNNRDVADFLKNCSKSSRFLYSALSQFSPLHIIEFFNARGCPLKQEDHQRMFPKSNQARDILKVLLDSSMKIEVNQKIQSVHLKNNRIINLSSKDKTFKGDHFIIATGGKSFPSTGSDGSGYELLKACHHTITNLCPVEVALQAETPLELQGLSLENVKFKVLVNHKVKLKERGDILFTHFGLSGPAILKVSEFVLDYIKKSVSIQLDLSEVSFERGLIKDALAGKIPKRLVNYLVDQLEAPLKPIEQTSKKELEKIRQRVLFPTFKITGSLPIERAFVTKGGVKTSDIDPMTMKSKLVDNLSICGEVLDCHGAVGGYNLTIALSSGYCAGNSV